jgi:sialic acid synthase SpsE
MARVTIVSEIGSTHLGREALVKEAIERSMEADADVVKFQLFPNEERFTKSGNIWMSQDLFLYALQYGREIGMKVTASAFDDESVDFLIGCDVPFVKFAYSQKENAVGIRKVINQGMDAVVSCDHLTFNKVSDHALKLLCIPQYPVYFDVRFESVFPQFYGYSDHSLGIDTPVKAVVHGARMIEKHVRVAPKGCPDCDFALTFQEFGQMVKEIRRWEREPLLGNIH